MQFGMNVRVDPTGESAARFIRTCAKANMKALRLTLVSPKVPKPVLTALADCGSRAAWSLLTITSQNRTEMFNALKIDLAPAFGDLALQVPADSLGVILPEGLHFVLRVGQNQRAPDGGIFGFRKEELRAQLQAMVEAIHSHGQKAVLSCRAEDITGQVWTGLDFDIFEIEQMLSRNLQSAFDTPAMREVLAFEKKPYWHSKAGIVGGYIVPAEQAKLIRKIATLDTGALFAFLWSEPASPKWAWSRDGEFVVDTLPEAFTDGSTASPVLGGNGVADHWKTQQDGSQTP